MTQPSWKLGAPATQAPRKCLTFQKCALTYENTHMNTALKISYHTFWKQGNLPHFKTCCIFAVLF